MEWLIVARSRDYILRQIARDLGARKNRVTVRMQAKTGTATRVARIQDCVDPGCERRRLASQEVPEFLERVAIFAEWASATRFFTERYGVADTIRDGGLWRFALEVALDLKGF